MAVLTDSYLTDLVAFVATVTVIIYAYFKWTYQHWKKRNIPYFEPSIPFGNTPNPFTSKISAPEFVKQLYDEAKSKGWKYCGMYAGVIPSLLVTDLDLLKNVMTKDFAHFVDRGIYVNEKDDPMGCHLFALGGARWRNLRAKLTPTFTSGKMKMMFQTIADCGIILEKHIGEHIAGKEVVDIKEVLARFSTDVIGSCAFGLECNSFKDPDNPFRVYGKKVLEATSFELVKVAFSLNFPNIARALGIRQVDKDVSDFYTKVVQDTITYRRKNNVTRNDFMQLLMEMMPTDETAATGDGNTLTLDEIAAQSFVFFIAGFETSSTTMTFALYEMATHQDVQDKVREEINRVLARHGNKITYDSMNELVYMKQVIDETLRMYPPVGLLTRECVLDYKIPGDDFVVEKGTTMFIPVMGYHYDEEYYPNPKKFDPERFNAENKKSRHPYAHIPFGEGPRICIGERFGIMQTKVGLTSLLKNFKISLDKKTTVPLKIDPKAPVTTAQGGIWLNIHKV